MKRLSRFRSTVEHRMLINYRVDPAVAQSLLPEGMRPQLVDGSAVAGICHIKQRALRPAWLSPEIGLRVEGSAHRIAVEWDDATGTHSGVYIAQRHTPSLLAQLAGGRLVPGAHKRARFSSRTGGELIHLSLDGGETTVEAEVALAETFRSDLFGDDLESASEFFRKGAIGWSPNHDGTLEGLEIEGVGWKVEPATAVSVSSSFFDALPEGYAVLDCVLVLRNVPFTWTAPDATIPALAAKS